MNEYFKMIKIMFTFVREACKGHVIVDTVINYLHILLSHTNVLYYLFLYKLMIQFMTFRLPIHSGYVLLFLTLKRSICIISNEIKLLMINPTLNVVCFRSTSRISLILNLKYLKY